MPGGNFKKKNVAYQSGTFNKINSNEIKMFWTNEMKP